LGPLFSPALQRHKVSLRTAAPIHLPSCASAAYFNLPQLLNFCSPAVTKDGQLNQTRVRPRFTGMRATSLYSARSTTKLGWRTPAPNIFGVFFSVRRCRLHLSDIKVILCEAYATFISSFVWMCLFTGPQILAAVKSLFTGDRVHNDRLRCAVLYLFLAFS
jgi:hypothetical protein